MTTKQQKTHWPNNGLGLVITLILFSLGIVSVSAQQVEVTLTEAGTLSEKISSDQKYTITSLKVSGPINGTDVRYLREMAGRDYRGGTTDGKLVDLDLADANIVKGGYYYIYSYNTEDNILSSKMFCECNLRSIKLPTSVTSIGDDAFRGCSSLTSVTIPNSVTSIGSSAFYYCSNVKTLTIEDGDVELSLNNRSSLPSSVEELYIGRNLSGTTPTFGKSLVEVTIGSKVTSINPSQFSGCSNLTFVTIPNSVTNIGSYAFYNCSSLSSVTIGNSVTYIRDYAFYNCSSLSSIAIPNSVTSIGDYVFSGCSQLSSVTIGNSVTYIRDYAFYNCSSLTSVTIPNSVTSIGDWAFSSLYLAPYNQP